MPFASYCPYNLGVNFPVYTVVANSFVVLHAHTLHLSIVGCHKNAFTIYGTWSTATLEVRLKDTVQHLTTNDAFCHCLTSVATCYQFMQSVLKICFALAKKVVGGQVSAQGILHMAAA